MQSRFYRCPEIAIGLPYSHPVDMWSFGCILIEMITGRPLFPALDERELIEIMFARIGTMPDHMVKKAKKKHMFFNVSKDNQVLRSPKSRVPKGITEGEESVRKML